MVEPISGNTARHDDPPHPTGRRNRSHTLESEQSPWTDIAEPSHDRELLLSRQRETFIYSAVCVACSVWSNDCTYQTISSTIWRFGALFLFLGRVCVCVWIIPKAWVLHGVAGSAFYPRPSSSCDVCRLLLCFWNIWNIILLGLGGMCGFHWFIWNFCFLVKNSFVQRDVVVA